MKVLHITFSSKGGAGIAALRLHEALQRQGVKSAYLSVNLTINFNNEIVTDDFFTYRKPTFLKKGLIKFQNYLSFTNRQKIFKEFNKIKYLLEAENLNLPYSNQRLKEHPLVKETDVINLHWLDGILDYSSFFKKCQKPIIWTLHDMNPFQGLFHYQGDQVLNYKKAGNLDYKIKVLKEKAIKSIKNGTIISPSKWLLDEAKKSNVFINFEKQCIPNSVNLDHFDILNADLLRENHNIRINDFVILFVSDSVKNYRKGFDLLLDALLLVNDIQITLLVVGKGTVPTKKNLRIIALGEIKLSSEMAEYYNMANVFILPSREDNLPNVMLESFACGTALVAFNIGGVAEHTIDNLTGVLAEEISAISLAKAIQKFYKKRHFYDKSIIRKYAENNFNYEKQASSYISVYEKSLNRYNCNKISEKLIVK